MLSGHKAIAPMQPWMWPESLRGLCGTIMFFFLLLMTAHSKWLNVYEMTSTTVQKTIDILCRIIASYGLPEQLVSDNGPQFVAKEFEEFIYDNGIKHIRSAPYHPV